ncbi:orotate phosphoribosyltransferase [Taylorella equigenitalis]|uniref:Orotate phosphoribosyltransferase n=3 Tax=Taylorella equigenitalis TaxID=29575 RepID=A0A654KG36_TAYEM|nr:orotate phosphoribosyltransferase [Taylorella equigenitalis]ADU91392.1 Orotate phosphoribosyltransferase [Taylorella equigenitalis MCE9]AFN36480.1 orotate phosphoribosyltransferase [Taylorella equigenitalis ATCC 35865]ASY31046.1 orotate phosphoribosyltransferase [Taylorella equigenitalis]ASY38348.1 orotate phosphoribosyltransferase [Taylorella equigenitalis]ASY39881.1 orotate phosphoribosyltransferase [Taylorella equigenitalis]
MSQSKEFVKFALNEGVLKFGEFQTKSGRLSPYFFNAGLFNNGESLFKLANFYAQALLDSEIKFDMIFGPAYKGIPLAAATAIAISQKISKPIPFCFNRKEAKDHGEGGTLVGAPLSGNVIIIDDVITAGTSVRESVNIIQSAHAKPAGVLIALDRMERSGYDSELSASSSVQRVQQIYGIPVVSIANLNDIMDVIKESPEFKSHQDDVEAYRKQYGIS